MKQKEEQLVAAPVVQATLTRKDLEAVFRVSGRTIDRLTAAGEFPRPIHVGRSCRWRAADVMSYMERRGREAAPRD